MGYKKWLMLLLNSAMVKSSFIADFYTHHHSFKDGLNTSGKKVKAISLILIKDQAGSGLG